MIPRQASESSDLSGKSDKMEDIMEDLESDAFMSPTESHEASPAHSSTKLNSPLNQIVSMEDLDLLPTKEEAQKHILKGWLRFFCQTNRGLSYYRPCHSPIVGCVTVLP